MPAGLISTSLGKDLVKLRNYDHGAESHNDISCLSFYIRRRIITEEGVIRSILRRHSKQGSEEFMQEKIL